MTTLVKCGLNSQLGNTADTAIPMQQYHSAEEDKLVCHQHKIEILSSPLFSQWAFANPGK